MRKLNSRISMNNSVASESASVTKRQKKKEPEVKFFKVPEPDDGRRMSERMIKEQKMLEQSMRAKRAEKDRLDK